MSLLSSVLYHRELHFLCDAPAHYEKLTHYEKVGALQTENPKTRTRNPIQEQCLFTVLSWNITAKIITVLPFSGCHLVHHILKWMALGTCKNLDIKTLNKE